MTCVTSLEQTLDAFKACAGPHVDAQIVMTYVSFDRPARATVTCLRVKTPRPTERLLHPPLSVG
jgi:hypothetical protein